MKKATYYKVVTDAVSRVLQGQSHCQVYPATLGHSDQSELQLVSRVACGVAGAREGVDRAGVQRCQVAL